ncbi:MAG: histidinol dehydrogenase [SAR324 cluster bacterium]|jgi:histidinol dehydrogenase|nr:histidinol dehydrogenase [SAR324 cluster bacterium]MDP6248949.1 histidinol dehydrogenase [SAR324 cluster bacterium]MDP7140511.1 histidinol dehydrogenase [SAR324 cluster bacterium]MDP7333930.1 histidinol dehydrogenase [SAR324 cluster bacterium]|tara:strand:- start:7976 stop:9259 length:1284 start_codon:yes stop_codon:yes gene_type:complete
MMEIKLFEGFQSYCNQLPPPLTEDISSTVSGILEQVRKNGDTALRELTLRFDGVKLDSIRVKPEDLQSALESLDPKLRLILEKAAENIRSFHQRQKTESQLEFSNDGTMLGWKVTPLDSVGIYVPGGRAVYPSTLLMNVIPAQVAGVSRIAMVSPPNETGLPATLVQASAALLGVEKLYSIGGAQAVGALTWGTDSVPAVVKITGPGNAFVAEAKRQVFGRVGIDSFAGPSEIMVVCDREEMPVEFLVRDLLSQAEHDPEAGAILVTTSREQAENVRNRLQQVIPTLPRREIIEESFASRSALIICKSKQECFDAVNEMAPEHLELLTEDPFQDLHRVRNAGAIFLGPNTPEAVGDYYAGPNHTLPTSGCARFSSPLGVQDFIKTSSVLSYSEERLQCEGPAIIRFAEEEKLFAHAESVRVRMKDSN